MRRGVPQGLRMAFGLSPGLVDAGLSSMAGFAASLYAARHFEGGILGAYGLYLAALTVASLIPQQLVYLPSQIASLEVKRAARPRLLAGVLGAGVGLGLMAGFGAAVSGVVLSSQVSTSALVAFGTGAAVLTWLMPAQDQLRSAFYLAGQPQRSAVLAAVQLSLTVAALGTLHFSDIREVWLPFSALAIGGAGSTIVGLIWALRGEATTSRLEIRPLLRSGASLLPTALVQDGSMFVSQALLGTIASAAALGSAEAARVASRPLQVFSLGVSRSTAPRLMEAGRERSTEKGLSATRTYALLLLASGAVYLAVAGWQYGLNPIQHLIPAAFDVKGLAALTMLAMTLAAVSQIPRAVLLGARHNRSMLINSCLGAIARIGSVLVLASSLEAYALPVAWIAGAVVSGMFGLKTMRGTLDRP